MINAVNREILPICVKTRQENSCIRSTGILVRSVPFPLMKRAEN